MTGKNYCVIGKFKQSFLDGMQKLRLVSSRKVGSTYRALEEGVAGNHKI